MTSSYKHNDGFIYDFSCHTTQCVDFLIVERDPVVINTAVKLFEEQVDYDIESEKRIAEEIKRVRAECLFKILIFPLEWIYVRLAIGKNAGVETKLNVGLYWQYYFNKIGFDKFVRLLGENLKGSK